jgi:hypothetical protein
MKNTIIHVTRQGLQTCPHCGYVTNAQANVTGRPCAAMRPGAMFFCGQCLKPSRAVQDGLLLGLSPIQDQDMPPAAMDHLRDLRAEVAKLAPGPHKPEKIQQAIINAIARASRTCWPSRTARLPRRPGGLPVYWRAETTGVLAAAVKKYLARETLDAETLEFLRLYFEQWYASPVWERNAHYNEAARQALEAVRREIARADTVEQIRLAEAAALNLGIDAL